MYTLGYEFKPWVNKKDIADGDDIRNIREAAQENKVKSIRFSHEVIGAASRAVNHCGQSR